MKDINADIYLSTFVYIHVKYILFLRNTKQMCILYLIISRNKTNYDKKNKKTNAMHIV